MRRSSYSFSARTKQVQQAKLQLIRAGIALFLLAFISLFIYLNLGTGERTLAEPGKDGSITITTANWIVNEFTTLSSNASAGATQITVAGNNLNVNSRFSAALAAGDLVMIIQMQGASISTSDASTYGSISSYNNAGRYELADVSGISGTTKINLVNGLKNSYTAAGKVQVIRVPRFVNLTINAGASVTTQAWNGSTGGVLAMEVNGNAIIDGTVNVEGKGFRGGTVEQNSSFPGNHTKWRSTNTNDGAEKGESIAGDWTTYDGLSGRYGRGAPANGGGGGNSHNASGGGGANGGVAASWNGKGNPDLSGASWTTCWNLEGGSFGSNTSSGGGRGGYSYSANASNPATKAPADAAWGGDNRYNVGGYGGRPLDYSGGRIFMGGGGGAGDSNDGTGTSGAAGGGIVLITNGSTVTGTGTIDADGASAGTTAGPQGWDGTGGGGGGGTVLIYTRGGAVSNLTIYARGGTGGSQYITGDPEAEGSGGGGGGGYITVTASSGLTTSVTGGSQGTTNSTTMTAFTPNGGTKGGAGTVTSPPANPYSATTTLPVKLVYFHAVLDGQVVRCTWQTASEEDNDYFTVERSEDALKFSDIGQVDAAGAASTAHNYSFTDPHPLGGISYYRLKQTDFNGHSETFSIISIRNGEKTTAFVPDDDFIRVGPNPFSQSFHATIITRSDGPVSILLIAANGALIRSEEVQSYAGHADFEFREDGKLPAGLYFLKVTGPDQETKTVRLIKN